MSQAVAKVEPPRQKSVVLDMANRYGMEMQAFEATVRKTCGADNCSPEQFAAFLLVAKQYELNPILKEIYAFPARGGGIVPIVSIDGWVNLINSTPQADGFDFDMETDAQGKPVSCTCTMYRKDRSHPVIVTEYFEECKRNTDPWKTHPHRMLRHKTLIQAARYAFGFAGIYDEDEGARIAQMRDVTPQEPRPDRNTYIGPPANAGVGPEPEAEPEQPATEDDDGPVPGDAGPAFTFTNEFGEVLDEPLDGSDFIAKLFETMDAIDTGPTIKALLEHNADDIAALADDMQAKVNAHISYTRDRIRTLIEDAKRKEAGEAEEAGEPDNTESEQPADRTADTSTEDAPSEPDEPQPPAGDFVVEPERTVKGDVMDRASQTKILKVINKAPDAATVDAIIAANADWTKDLKKIYRDAINDRAAKVKEGFEK